MKGASHAEVMGAPKKAGRGGNFLPPLNKKFARGNVSLGGTAETEEDPNASLKEINMNAEEFLGLSNKNRDKHIKESFTLCQDKLDAVSKIDAVFSGTTCVVCYISKNNLVVANSGDSRAIMCSINAKGAWTCTQLSRDHKPEEPDEAIRVKKCNGRIE